MPKPVPSVIQLHAQGHLKRRLLQGARLPLKSDKHPKTTRKIRRIVDQLKAADETDRLGALTKRLSHSELDAFSAISDPQIGPKLAVLLAARLTETDQPVGELWINDRYLMLALDTPKPAQGEYDAVDVFHRIHPGHVAHRMRRAIANVRRAAPLFSQGLGPITERQQLLIREWQASERFDRLLKAAGPALRGRQRGSEASGVDLGQQGTVGSRHRLAALHGVLREGMKLSVCALHLWRWQWCWRSAAVAPVFDETNRAAVEEALDRMSEIVPTLRLAQRLVRKALM
jgi:hypothetical protein